MGAFDILQCDQGSNCKSSIELGGSMNTQCHVCRLSPNNEDLPDHHFRPLDPRKPHPILKAEKREAARLKTRAAHDKRMARDRGKVRVYRKATRAEKKTESNIITSTRNSGRVNRDGDHLVDGRITLDTKLQSQREHPVVNLAELRKVRNDAENANSIVGGLILRNKHGVGVVVFAEEDLVTLVPHFTGGNNA
jgi:hypothetical protein